MYKSSLGASTNAGPHYEKLYVRVTHIWGNCKGQPDPSAMKGPRLERTASLITVPPASGKFFLCLKRMSSPPVGLVQWLSDITSNPQQRRRCAMSPRRLAKNGGAPSRQLRRGIEPRLHKIKTKKQNTSKSAGAHKTETGKPAQ